MEEYTNKVIKLHATYSMITSRFTSKLATKRPPPNIGGAIGPPPWGAKHRRSVNPWAPSGTPVLWDQQMRPPLGVAGTWRPFFHEIHPFGCHGNHGLGQGPRPMAPPLGGEYTLERLAGGISPFPPYGVGIPQMAPI